MAAWYCGGDSSVANDPFRALGSTQSYTCLPLIQGSAGGNCFIPHYLRDLNGL
jgi:hypothetical protein